MIVDFLNGRLPAYVDTGLNLVDVRDVAPDTSGGRAGTSGSELHPRRRNLTLQQMLELLGRLTGLSSPKVRCRTGFRWPRPRRPRVARWLGSHRASRSTACGCRSTMMFFDAGKAVRELGFPQSPIEPALSRAVAWFRENGHAGR